MNKFQSLLLPLIAALAFTFTACGEDDTPPPTPIGPTVSAISGMDLVTDVDTVAPLAEFTVRVSAESGNSKMLSITVSEDGTNIDVNRLTFDAVPGSANPILLFDADTAGFTKDISIIAHGTAAETHTYTISVRDANGETSEISVDIYTEEPVVTTPLDDTYTQRMFANAAGSTPDGGMDLSVGMAVSVNSPDADIIDAGIDINEPNATNWIQKIEPANGAILVIPAAGFDYDAVATKEAITEGYDAGTVATTTDKVQEGDVYFVRTAEATYVFKVTGVEVKPGTPGPGNGDNTDNYTLEIKF